MKKSEKLTVVFVPRRSRIRPYKMAKALKYTNKVRIILLCEESFYDPYLFDGIFDEVHFFTRKNILFKIPKAEKVYRRINERVGFGFNKMMKIIRTINPDLIHCFAEPYNHIAHILKNTEIPVIMSDGADFTGITSGIENLTPRKKILEKYCFERVNGIILKGPEDVINYYKSNDYNLNCKFLSWFDHIDLDNTKFINVDSKKIDSELHLVYTGNISTNENMNYCYYIPLAKILSSQKIHLHIYPNPWQYNSSSEYLKLDEEDPYFHFHKPKNMRELISEISNFDFGIWIHGDGIGPRSSLAKQKTGIGNKLFTYIESGLPVIVSDSRSYGKHVVVSNKIGIAVHDYEWVMLRKLIQNLNACKLRQNVKDFQHTFSLKANGLKVFEFYKKILYG